ncbi:histidine kinase dimerization/phospho-acceptor domain-containing protein [Desulfococcaceae bacterium HSG7]|nr:histidine kinase dimerization/phospho-acceptor domain-containing protein [Desulfococcaceae bacterium HSG7]
MSHELRTPLNAIMGFSQLLGHSTNLDPDEKKNLATIRSSGEHLLNLINDVLDMSKFQAGRTVFCVEDFDMYHLLDNVEAMFSAYRGAVCLRGKCGCPGSGNL